MADDAPLTIPADIYMLLGEIKGQNASLLQQFGESEGRHTKRNEEVDRRLNSHGERISTLERDKASIAGGAVAIRVMLWLLPTVLAGVVGVSLWLGANGLEKLLPKQEPKQETRSKDG